VKYLIGLLGIVLPLCNTLDTIFVLANVFMSYMLHEPNIGSKPQNYSITCPLSVGKLRLICPCT
jgi:hypothetical protein